MFDRVKLVCDANITIIDGVPALADSYTNFKNKLIIVKERMAALSNDENGLAANKDLVWMQLALALKGITAGLRAYARKQGNLELLALAKYTKSAFKQDRGTEAVALATNLIALAQANIASLANYNVTPAKMTAATTLLAQLTAANPKPVAQRTNDKVLRQLLYKQVKDTSDVLTGEMDELVRTLEDEEPLFSEEYFAARRIYRTGIRHEQPEGAAKAKKTSKQETKKEEEETKKEEQPNESRNARSPETSATTEYTSIETGHPATNGSSPPDDAPSGGEGQTEAGEG